MKIGPWTKRNSRCPDLPVVVDDLRPGDVGRHQVGGELDAAELERQALGQRLHQQGLGEAGNPFEDAVPARKDAGHQLVDDVVLADDHGMDLLADAGVRVAELLQGLQVGKSFVRVQFVLLALGKPAKLYELPGSSRGPGGVNPPARFAITALDPLSVDKWAEICTEAAE